MPQENRRLPNLYADCYLTKLQITFQLAEHLGQCHSLIDETKELALTVALRYGELIKQDIEKLFQEQLDKKKRSFGTV